MCRSPGRVDAGSVVRFTRFLIVSAALLLLAAPSSAFASQMIDRNATHVSIAVNMPMISSFPTFMGRQIDPSYGL